MQSGGKTLFKKTNKYLMLLFLKNINKKMREKKGRENTKTNNYNNIKNRGQ